jgi:hypothetical protein
LPAYCGWAAEQLPDPIRIRHICDASRASGIPSGAAVAAARPSAAESLASSRAMNACPFRSRGPGCGCAGGRCALRRGAVVSHLDCFACIETYG